MEQLTHAQGEPRAMLRFPILIHEVKFWIKKLNQEKKVFSVLNWKKVCFLEPTATAEKKKKGFTSLFLSSIFSKLTASTYHSPKPNPTRARAKQAF